MKSCKSSCLTFGAWIEAKEARTYVLRLTILAGMDFSFAASLTISEAELWLEEAIEVRKEWPRISA